LNVFFSEGDKERTISWLLDNPPKVSGEDRTAFSEIKPLEPNICFKSSYLLMRVRKVEKKSRNMVCVLLMDRNRTPLDPFNAPSFRLPLKLLHQKLLRELTSNETALIETELTSRIPRIVFITENRREFSPLSITPLLDLREYKIEFDSRSQTIKHLTHAIDGQVLFRASQEKVCFAFQHLVVDSYSFFVFVLIGFTWPLCSNRNFLTGILLSFLLSCL
jgi:hypothetical protein